MSMIKNRRPPSKKERHYREFIRDISTAIINCQRPIHILDSIKWDEDVISFFLKTRFREIPALGPLYYQKNRLPFSPQTKLEEFKNIRQEISRKLPKNDPVAGILRRNCHQYEDVVRMLMSRGTEKFYQYSRKLFGSTDDVFDDGKTKICELGKLLEKILGSIEDAHLGKIYPKIIPDREVVKELNRRLSRYFGENVVRVKLTDGILSDASAGSDYIKIRKGAFYNTRDIDIFEVHEGWVHVGTTLNGMSQPHAKWLAKGPPCTSATQEGLAVLMEIFSFVSSPERAKKINNRIFVCDMVEKGANILEIIEYYRERGHGDREAVQNAQRTFRGGLLEGGAPFTKDISYCKGFIMIYNFLRSAIRLGRPEIIPFLFAGKVTLEDIPVLYELYQRGILERPKNLPPQFADLNGLSVWMAFSNFLNTMGLEKISDSYKKKLKLVA